MNQVLSEVLSGDREPGVFRSTDPIEEIRAEAELHDWTVRVLSRPVSSKDEALAALGEALDFPADFGHNLDALWDCLRDLDEPLVLVWQGADGLDRLAFDPIIDVLQERADQGGFAVVLTGS